MKYWFSRSSVKVRCWVDSISYNYFCVILLYQDGLVFQEPLGVRANAPLLPPIQWTLYEIFNLLFFGLDLLAS